MLQPKLFQVFPTSDYSVYLFYDNGEIRLYDCSWILNKSGVFTKLHDIENFKELCTIMNGTLAWDISECRDFYNCIDICPDTVYQESVKTRTDPLKIPA
ncbi:MAG: DUF2442 domain-containing protein [Spirochaeta sp.]|nr:DUF2442 domain-containing protein [Spirochaeta sp.]